MRTVLLNNNFASVTKNGLNYQKKDFITRHFRQAGDESGPFLGKYCTTIDWFRATDSDF